MLTVSIVIPTRNEEANIAKLLDRLSPYGYQIIVVDDSDDQTAVIASSMGAEVVKGKRQGLGQAIIDGIEASNSDVVLVMDADMSHDPSAVADLLKPILEQGFDFAIGSRYVKGGDFSNWSRKRQIQSLIGVKLMKLVTGVNDSNSGFFAFRKSILDGVKLKPHSWKIMLEVLFKGNWIAKTEVPITFRDRFGGESKNSNRERMRHTTHMFKLLIYKFRRYIQFATVGGVGAIWYFGLLYTLTEFAGLWYGFSAIIGTLVAITNNYLINHFWTFRKLKKQNSNLVKGWLKYVGNSAFGDGLDWLTLILLTEVFGIWYMLSAFIASGVASVVKYTIAKTWIWGRGRKATDCDYEWASFYRGLPWQKFSKQKIAKTIKKLAGNGKVVVDVGCGSSPQGLLVTHSGYTGMDIDEGKITYMGDKKLKNAEFKVGNVLNLPFEDGYADAVIFSEVLEHLADEVEVSDALGELARVTRLGGRVIVAQPDFESLPGRIMERLYGVFHPGAYAEDHRVKLDDYHLRFLFCRHGLSVEKKVNLLKRDIIYSLKKEIG